MFDQNGQPTLATLVGTAGDAAIDLLLLKLRQRQNQTPQRKRFVAQLQAPQQPRLRVFDPQRTEVACG